MIYFSLISHHVWPTALIYMYILSYSGSHTVHKIEGFDSRIIQVSHIIDVYTSLYPLKFWTTASPMHAYA